MVLLIIKQVGYTVTTGGVGRFHKPHNIFGLLITSPSEDKDTLYTA